VKHGFTHPLQHGQEGKVHISQTRKHAQQVQPTRQSDLPQACCLRMYAQERSKSLAGDGWRLYRDIGQS
jgi:hypothetical protein